jgi:hypothetical protein
MSTTTLRAGAIAIAALVTLACGEERRAGNEAATSVTSGSTGGSSSSGGGSAGGPGAGGMGGGAIPPADIACIGDFAFRAVGMSFAPPTPKDLAVTLGELTYSATEHPIAVVLRSSDATATTLAASATMEDSMALSAFVTDLQPTFTEAAIAQGSFGSLTTQLIGYLRVRHDAGFLDLELANLNVQAATSSSCGQAFATLDASIPAAEREKSLTLPDGETTVGDLAGGDPADDIQLRALFSAESVEFDFDSL